MNFKIMKLLLINLCLFTVARAQAPKEFNYIAPTINSTPPKKIHKPTPAFILHLYQLMKDVHDLLTLNNIAYWADGGALIGAVRHKGIIKWDWDLDIDMHINNKEQFEKLIPQLKNLKYDVQEMFWLGYKITAMSLPEITKPSLDIFFWQQENDEYSYDSKTNIVWGKRDGKPIYMKEEELLPLKLYEFGAIKIFAANNPKPYLDNLYGDNWPFVGYGLNLTTLKRESWILSEKDKEPAQPLGPLANRIR